MRLNFSPQFFHSLSSLAVDDDDRLLTTAPAIAATASTVFVETMTTTMNVATTTTVANNNNALGILWSPETVLPPINEISEPWVRSLVWLDFKVAVAFFVVVPLILLSWAVVARLPPPTSTTATTNEIIANTNALQEVQDKRLPIAETILRYMTSYWQASSLLLLTIALDIQEYTICVVVGLFAQVMIIVSLWWWEDLNQELRVLDLQSCDDGEISGGEQQQQQQQQSSSSSSMIRRVFLAWRNVATVAASSGVLIQVPFQSCVGVHSLTKSSWCAPWLEPPQFTASLVGVVASPTLDILTKGGCALYALVLLYYSVVLLPLVGRSGRAVRPTLMNTATPIGVWQRLSFLDKQ